MSYREKINVKGIEMMSEFGTFCTNKSLMALLRDIVAMLCVLVVSISYFSRQLFLVVCIFLEMPVLEGIWSFSPVVEKYKCLALLYYLIHYALSLIHI